jgi:CheY-like chemotaxis protein
MDHTHSQLPLGGFYDAYDELLLATKDDPSTHEKVKALAHHIAGLAPRQRIRTVVDNSASNSANTDSSIVDYMANQNSCGNGCSPSTDVVATLQASPQTPPVSVSTPSSTPINAGSKSALVVEDDKSLLRIIRELLKREGYVVRSAPDCAEGLRLYGFFAPFDVVLIDYCVPPTVGVAINHLAPQQKDGVELALAIHKINPSQEMIIAAFDYQSEHQVPRRPTELTHVPVLVSTLQLRNLLEKLQYWATREEIDQAIAALSPAQWQKLQKFAEWKVRGLGRSAGNRGKDLLQDALLSSFVGAQDNGNGRRWNKRVDFLMHLTGAMRGISSHWPDKFNEREVLECEAINCDAEGQELSPLDNLGRGDTPDERFQVAVAEGFQPAAERRLIAKEEIKRIFRMFQDDKEATLVREGWSEGMKKNEIVQKYELTAKQYDAATKRIRVRLLGPRNAGGGAEKHGR